MENKSERDMAMIPYFVHEGIMVRFERTIKRLIIALIIAVVLHYKLVDNYTYEDMTELLYQETGRYLSDRTIKRMVYRAEAKLFPQLQIIYNGKRI